MFFREIQLVVEMLVGAGIPLLCQIYNHWHTFVERNQLKRFQRGYRYYEMLTLLNVDPNLKEICPKNIQLKFHERKNIQ